MYNAMMDPEMMRLAQEQMSRIPPEELARIQQQMMSNPELLKLATESMKNLRPEDMRRAAEQLKHARTEDMVKVSEKMAKATPEEISAMKAHADAQISYELNAAMMLKKQGNELHSCGQYYDAAKKYLLAKNNLKGIPSSQGGTLQLQCSLNLMSCYLKTRQFEDCIKEGSEVLAYDSKNVKALYRRGQAFKQLGKLDAAVSDLKVAYAISPEDETIADVLRDANEKLMKEGGDRNVSQGLVIEEIVEEETEPEPSDSHRSALNYSVTQSVEAGESSQKVNGSYPGSPADSELLQSFKDDPENVRLFQSYVSNAEMSPDIVKSATEMMSSMNPEELQKVLQVASSLSGQGPDGTRLGSKFPEMTPEMVKMASDSISKMSPEELQKMLKAAASLNVNSEPFPTPTGGGRAQRSESVLQSSVASGSSSTQDSSAGRNAYNELLNSNIGQPSSSIPASTADLQESMRNSLQDPAMRQMFTSMMKNMSPDMMANMSEQFGMKLSKEEAAKAQQAMSSLSPEDLDRMMRWAERAQRGFETIKKTKNWLLGRPGMILAIVVLILAFIFHQLGFIGG
ncbi:outer envelope protein 61 isoform X2 [Elaeis guineensis]|uniref:Outer envelope protein 61 isoform X2 n=1 Tax=Elaeis guineensis var. tenera TaxID=51953 RepID=A0A6I9QJ52_ELAGV|nr:outer envelope protein 61 isoform X2 [Elaeis guineensis]